MEKKLTIHQLGNGFLLTQYSLDGQTKTSNAYKWGENGEEEEMIEKVLKILELTKYTIVTRTEWAKEQVKNEKIPS